MLFEPLSAGPISICSGFWDCLPLTVALYAVSVLPVIVGIFAIFTVTFFSIKKRKPNWKWLCLFMVASVLLGHFGYFAFAEKKDNDEYQAIQSEEATALTFTLYEPTYVVPGYDLVENQVDFGGALVFRYYDRSTMESPDTVAYKRYLVKVQSLGHNPRRGIGVNGQKEDGELLAQKKLGNTIVYVAGTGINRLEAQKVIGSMKKVAASEIEFRSDWASSR